jgi:transposase-like protein/ribosomal protein L40E
MTENFPRTVLDFESTFATEGSCREYIMNLRWPEGFICPRCQAKSAWSAQRDRLICASCRYQASATAGTIFQDTHKPLRLWFRAMWYVTSQKNGASALGLQRVLGLGSYLTAWTWLHKLRRAMVRPGRDRLDGRVEVDETLLGGVSEGPRGRGSEGKALIVIAAQEDGKGVGRIRMAQIASASSVNLHGFIEQVIEPGATVHTDGWHGYSGIGNKNYRHEATVLSGRGKNAAAELLPRIHIVASLLKRWLMGTHQGAVSFKHLDYYLDEFTFRFNRRKSGSRGKLFYRLMEQAVAVAPAPYNSLVGGKGDLHCQTQPVVEGGVN